MLEKVEIIKNDEKTNVDLISEFEITEGSNINRYALLTANEIDQNGLIKILATQISEGKMIRIQTEESWSAVKNVMRSIISGSKGDFKYTNTSDNMSYEVSEDYARIIAVQDVAKQALIKDYAENKPQVEVTKEESAMPAQDPNAGIYPTEAVQTPIGSEVVPGIAEVAQSADSSAVSIPILDQATNTQEEQEVPSAQTDSEDETPAPEETPVATPEVNPVAPEETVAQEPVQEEAEQAVAEPTIAETPVAETPVEEEVPEVAPTPIVAQTEETPEPTVNVDASSARDVLIQDITAAVDKYLASVSKSDDIKAKIAKLQEELNQMNEALQNQE